MPPPGRLKKPPPAVDVPKPGVPGWVNVRLNGCAALGAVDVLGGAEKVRVPRDPELNPPPARASAGAAAEINGNARAKTTAIDRTMPRARCVNLMSLSSIPGRGKRP
jgi:hypothetical protein